ncbi:enoyl-CoA hydratase family protein [Saccharopolyspora griseoalba]|uniref:Enoyl-CoA hydratase family protein n=1 Tax=Saccharopolyspora griseoalba TaxID=1431848 RepID=A0ABW2LNJ9_9PSEU
MTEPLVRCSVGGGAATVVLDSPHNRNALSNRLVAELHQGLADAAEDPEVRAVVLTHTGGTFCAGADLSDAGQSTTEECSRAMAELLRAIVELPKPVLGRVDGHVRAGGMGLVGACDVVAAGKRSTFSLTEARLGLAPSIISLTVLPRLTSRAASRYFLTGETFGPAQAERLGLITEAAEAPDAAVGAVLAQVRECSPQGLAESKRLTTAEVLAGFDESAELLASRSASLFETPEAMEGMTAFLEKRAPPGRSDRAVVIDVITWARSST